MALSSYEHANHPVELSQSALFSQKYHSIYRSIQDLSKGSESYEELGKLIRDFCFGYSNIEGNVYNWQTDVTSIVKPHSPCLEARGYVNIPNNVIAGNKPLSHGYKYSYINIGLTQPSYSDPQKFLEKLPNSKWTAPLSIARIPRDATPIETAKLQVNSLLEDEDLPFSTADLICNTLDSYYGNAKYLSAVHHHENLVNIVRLRGGIKIYPQGNITGTGGADQIYGACHYLIEKSGWHHFKHKGESRKKYRDAVLDLPCDETVKFQTQTAKGKKLRIEVKRFNNMMLRTKKGCNMKDKPFDLLYCRVFNKETGKALFKPMWLAITGKKRRTVGTFQGYCKYSHRYDIEPFFRFEKQDLLLDKYQTPDVENLDNWILIVQMAVWLLWTASDEATKNPKEWQKYLPEYKTDNEEELKQNQTDNDQPKASPSQSARLTIAQTRKGAQTLFMTFDKEPFVVQKSNKGKGRQKGVELEPRKRYKVTKKEKNLVQKRKT